MIINFNNLEDAKYNESKKLKKKKEGVVLVNRYKELRYIISSDPAFDSIVEGKASIIVYDKLLQREVCRVRSRKHTFEELVVKITNNYKPRLIIR
jgi:hypothetical protein